MTDSFREDPYDSFPLSGPGQYGTIQDGTP